MIEKRSAQSRHKVDHGWLQSYFSFSFGDYHDPKNVSFGPLRVLNDDVIKPGRGFGTHPHQEMEIVSILLQGSLKHEDSDGHSSITSVGGVQRMSAGTGIFHSEMNPSTEEEVHLFQMWFFPDQNGLTPSYEQVEYDQSKMKNRLLPIVAKNPAEPGVAHINQDLTIYLSELERGMEITFTQSAGRRLFLFVIEGRIEVNGSTILTKRDSARMTEVENLSAKASEKTKWMLIDLPF
ncbi:pirin family protein [Mechercharimyces sp. CAU 1602]|uniref:pirin family protein n=1 Tax=Mechercharimyces sp. CAU 1602 TaxID=2973933 RepID=UPI00216290F1|nr:pirin family protein [Mechercharimyces sp. CAU 1602]MCS1352095.1 pirin family protein [Mechercharimyces sp. CAU 1602]